MRFCSPTKAAFARFILSIATVEIACVWSGGDATLKVIRTQKNTRRFKATTHRAGKYI